MNYRVVPIPSEISRSVRAHMKSPQYGHRAFADVAKGYGPCRSCLQTFAQEGEERILFTYNAFENLSSLPLPGPVFIHKDECAPYAAEGFPADLKKLPLLFEAFAEESQLVAREPVRADALDAQLDAIFARTEVRFIYLRNAEAGCFVARIVRKD